MADSFAVRVTALHKYPVKGCRGVRVASARAGRRGFEGDRRWMIVDEGGRFLSQREVPRMVLVRCAIEGQDIVLRAPHDGPIRMPRIPRDGDRVEVEIWGRRCRAVVHEQASTWLSGVLGRPCRAVYMPEDVRRPVDGGDAGDVVSFADGYPYLLATEASLAELNRRSPRPLSMERFRPNIVVDGDLPFAEDAWRRIRIGELSFRVPKGCDRCSVTTVDPDTGETGREPLRTLATFRKRDGKVWFGVNLIPDGLGPVAVGDAVRVEG